MLTTFSENGATREIASWLQADSSIRALVSHVARGLPSARHVLLIGGVLRDRLLGSTARPKDVDFVVDGSSLDPLCRLIPSARRNFYGGLNFNLDGFAVDLWPLAETYHIREFGLEPTIENLLAGAPFNTDKAAFDVATETLFEDRFLDGLCDREIAYAPRNPYLEHVQAARCVLLRRKTGFSLAESSRLLLLRAAESMKRSDDLVIEVHKFLRDAHGIDDFVARRGVVTEIVSSAERAAPTVTVC